MMSENDFDLNAVGARIAERRIMLGLSQESIAELIGVTSQCISYAESGKRALRLKNLVKIASVLGVSTDYLLTGDVADNDAMILSEKIRNLTPDQLHLIEIIIDETHKLL